MHRSTLTVSLLRHGIALINVQQQLGTEVIYQKTPITEEEKTACWCNLGLGPTFAPLPQTYSSSTWYLVAMIWPKF